MEYKHMTEAFFNDFFSIWETPRHSSRMKKSNATICYHAKPTEGGNVNVYELVSYKTLVVRVEEIGQRVDVFFTNNVWFSPTTARQVTAFLHDYLNECVDSKTLRLIARKCTDEVLEFEGVLYHYIKDSTRRWGVDCAQYIPGVNCYA